MSNSSTSRDRTVVFVLNLLIFILSLCVTLNYFGFLGAYHDENNKWKNDTFFGFEMKFSFSENDIVELMPSEEYPDVDISDAIRNHLNENGKFVIPTQLDDEAGDEECMHFSIPTSMLWEVNAQMLKSLIKQFNFNIDTTGYTDVLTSENIDKNIDIIVSTLTPVIEDIAELVATETSADVNEVKDTLFNEFEQSLTTKFSTFLPKTLNEKLGDTLKFFAIILLVSTVTWLYLMLKIICKLFARNNAVKLKMPILFGAIPGFLWSTPKFLSFLASLIPMETLAKIIPMETITLFTETLSLSVFSCGWLAFIAMIALILFAIPYSASRRRLERRKLR